MTKRFANIGSSTVITLRQLYFFGLLCVCLLLIILYNIEISKPIVVFQAYYQILKSLKPKNELYCHLLNALDTLPEIQDSEVKKDESIFFMETSCSSYLNGKIIINARQACAVESAAVMNPNRIIYLLYASPGNFFDEKTESDRLIKNLMSYPNIKILFFNVGKFVKETPVENLWSTGQIQRSKYEVSHTSDILRLLILWKYGGIYLDMDVVNIKTLEDLPLNFAGAQSLTSINGAVLSFTSDGLGHQHVSACLHDISQHFDGSEWAVNGPGLITRMSSRLCNKSKLSEIINTTCQGFHIFPPSAFYPIYYPAWSKFFDESGIDYVKKMTKDSYLIHLWNKLSTGSKIPLNKNVPYIDFARTYCPGTILSLESYF